MFYVCLHAGPSALRVNIMKNSSIVVQWDTVDDFLPTVYTITWTSDRDINGVDTVDVDEPETSYTITGLTLDTVYTITVTAANRCGSGPEFRNRVSISTGTTSTTYVIYFYVAFNLI